MGVPPGVGDHRLGEVVISLVVATRNRPRELARLLRSLQQQTFKAFEILVVDQSDHETLLANRRALEVEAQDLSWLHLTSEELGLSRARNTGLVHVRGKVVGFPDDDCWYPPDVLERVAAWALGQIGEQLLAGTYTEPGRVNPAFPARPHPLTVWRLRYKVSSVALFIRACDLTNPELWFDASLGAGARLAVGEESDLVLRIMRRGGVGRFEPSLTVFHAISQGRDNLRHGRDTLECAYGYVLGKNCGHPLVLLKALGGVARLAGGVGSTQGRRRLVSRLRGLAAGMRASRVTTRFSA